MIAVRRIMHIVIHVKLISTITDVIILVPLAVMDVESLMDGVPNVNLVAMDKFVRTTVLTIVLTVHVIKLMANAMVVFQNTLEINASTHVPHNVQI